MRRGYERETIFLNDGLVYLEYAGTVASFNIIRLRNKSGLNMSFHVYDIGARIENYSEPATVEALNLR